METRTLIVNLIGGPGCSKSTTAAGIFFDLKNKNINCELVTEYAKDLVWSKSQFTLGNQIKVFGEQHNRIFRLLGQVEVVITDSPLLLTPIYDTRESDTLRTLAMEEFNSMWNYTVFLKRCKPYNPNGRNQDEDGAVDIDRRIADFLLDNQIPFETTKGLAEGKDYIVKKILTLLMRNTI